MRTMALAGLLLLSTCLYARPTTPSADLRDAELIAWASMGRNDPVPPTDLVTGSLLNCSNGTGWIAGDNKTCVSGLTYWPVQVNIAVPDGYAWHQTALCHEYLHVKLNLEGTPDPGHQLDAWLPGGVVDKCNKELEDAGY